MGEIGNWHVDLYPKPVLVYGHFTHQTLYLAALSVGLIQTCAHMCTSAAHTQLVLYVEISLLLVHK